MPTFIDITNGRFGKLTVIELAGHNRHGKLMWRCRCDCGRETLTAGGSLASGGSTACKHHRPGGIIKHGMIKTKTYRSWCAMKQRCLDLRQKSYKDYGGRGIHICDRWLDFVNFLADMGERPSGFSIDRINNEGN